MKSYDTIITMYSYMSLIWVRVFSVDYIIKQYYQFKKYIILFKCQLIITIIIKI